MLIVAIAWFSQWSGNGLVSFYLNKVFDTIGITDSTTQLLITGCVSCVHSFLYDMLMLLSSVVFLPSGTFAGLSSPRSLLTSPGGGRSSSPPALAWWCSSPGRPSVPRNTHCTGLPRLAMPLSRLSSYSTPHMSTCTCFCSSYGHVDLSNSIAFTPLIVSYTVEILPFSIRAKGFNVFNFVVSLALIFNQYVNPIALQNIGWKYYVRLASRLRPTAVSYRLSSQIFYCCWLFFQFAFCFLFIVETKNRTLEETAALFDGEDLGARVMESGVVAADEVRHDEHEDGPKISTLSERPTLDHDSSSSSDEKASA